MFQVVDVKVLYYLVDCVVFLVKGYWLYFNEMLGLDFDGDKYFVIWFDVLILKRKNEDLMDFIVLIKKVFDRFVGVFDMIEFILDYIKND